MDMNMSMIFDIESRCFEYSEIIVEDNEDNEDNKCKKGKVLVELEEGEEEGEEEEEEEEEEDDEPLPPKKMQRCSASEERIMLEDHVNKTMFNKLVFDASRATVVFTTASVNIWKYSSDDFAFTEEKRIC